MLKCSIAVAVVVCFMLVGCGGGGGGSSAPSPFAGHWVGTWTGDLGSGTADLTVSATGGTTGIAHDPSDDTNTSIAGTIANSGAATFTLSLTGYEPGTATGTFAIQGNGHLVGAVSRSGGGPTATFDLVKQ